MTVTHGLNLNNQIEVQEWFAKQFPRRARLTRWAAALLVAAIGCAGLAAVVSLLLGANTAPTLAVTRAADTVTVDLTFRDLDPGQVATATVTVDGQVVALAAFGPGTDGTATRTVTATKIPIGAAVAIDAEGSRSTCAATLRPGATPVVSCPRHEGWARRRVDIPAVPRAVEAHEGRRAWSISASAHDEGRDQEHRGA